MKYGKILLAITLLSALILTVGYQSTQLNGLYKKDLLLADFDQLIAEFEANHPKTFTHLDEFEAMRASQRDKITEMSEYDFHQLLAPVIGKMNCGHTYITADIADTGNYLPINVKVIDKAIYVAEDFSTAALEKGTKIHSINGQNVADIIDDIYTSLTSDGGNISAEQAKLNSDFGNYHSFEVVYHNFIASPKIFHISYSKSSDKKVLQTSFPAGKYTPYQEKNTSLSFAFKDNYATLTVPHFSTYQTAQFDSFSILLETFFSELNNKGINNLILDLRGNGGGDPYAGNLLLTYLLASKFQYFKSNVRGYNRLVQDSQIDKYAFSGNLYTLIDGLGFSTTGHILSHLTDQKRGTLIGQESGGGYICNDASRMVRLDNTNIGFNLPHLAYATSVQGQTQGRGIMPNIETKYSIKDYLNNTDLEMQSALDLIKN